MWLKASGKLITTETYEEVRWEDGILSGTPVGMIEFRNMALTSQGEPFGPVEGPYNYEDHMTNPWSVVGIVERIFFGYSLSVSASDDFPKRPPIPEGAIG